MAIGKIGVLREAAAVGFVVALFLPHAPLGFADPADSISSYDAPTEIVRKAVRNEIKAANDPTARFMFRGVKTTPKGSTSRIYVETKEATVGMVVGYNSNPLTPEQRHDEEARVERFIDNPDELRKKREQEKENSERSLRITRALPDAFIYEYAGEESGSPGVGRPGATLVKLKFRPNPKYQPPSHVEDVLAGMNGYVLVDSAEFRLASIDGTLFKEVAFGWGILGHLDSGGRFAVNQEEIGNDHWELSKMTLRFTGKIMMFKSLDIESTEVFSDFKKVPPDLTFAQGLELLKKEEMRTTEEASTSKLALRQH